MSRQREQQDAMIRDLKEENKALKREKQNIGSRNAPFAGLILR